MTPLQKVYDRFFSKIDEDMFDKEAVIFEYLVTAIAKSYKTVIHSLEYELVNDEFEGNFNDDLQEDEIELLALYMLYEHKRRRLEYLQAQERMIGTKDFNSIPDKVRETTDLRQGMKDLREEISDLKQDFNTFRY